MKRCPECRRDYFDDSLLYCLDDGSELLEGPASASAYIEPQTEILHTTDAPGDAATKHFIHTTNMPNAVGTPRFSVLRPLAFAAAALIIACAGYFGYRYFSSAAQGQISSLAVMPFVNDSGNADLDYLADGMTDSLISSLSQLPGLTVKARSAVFRYKGANADPKTVARDLSAQAILNGHVVGRGDQLTVTLELIDSQTENVIWAGRYERKLADLVSIQTEIARDVVAKLTPKLSGADQQRATRAAASDPEAYRLLLQGRYFLDRTTKEDTEKAIAYFLQASTVDPSCAVCWADAARAYSIQAGHAWVPEAEGFGRSREAVKRALAIDPDLAEGYAQLGRIQATFDLDVAGAEASYRRALALSPSSAAVQDGAAVLAYKLGHFDEAMDLERKAISEDPLNPAFYHNLGLTNFAAARLPDAERALRKSLELAPQRTVSHALLAVVLTEQGRGEEGFAEASREPDDAWRLWATAVVGQRAGRKKDSDDALQKMIALNDEGGAYQMAEVFAVRGDADKAFQWLETAYQRRDAGVTHAKVSPLLASLHSDARWAAFIGKLGLN
jgi:TolB-like protein/Tfp pilus assembly protein PilF